MSRVLAEYHNEVKDLRKNAVSTAEIAKMFGVSRGTVKNYCRAFGIKGVPSAGRNRNKEDDVAENIRNKNADLEYLEGYETKDSPLKLRCKKCGQVFTKTYHTLVHLGKAGCPECRRIESEERKAEQAKRLEAEREERERILLIKRLVELLEAEANEQSKVHRCPVCGKETSRPKYCSDECAKRANNKRKDIQRRAKVKAVMVDADITLESLFKRDRGICHICGTRCDLEDYVVRDTTIICGDWYPSIDHVIPLSKGGEHSWQNVKLAHRICNSKKGNRCEK